VKLILQKHIYLLAIFTIFLLRINVIVLAQDQTENSDQKENTDYTQQEKLRGSITPERQWWDVKHYDLSVRVMPETKTLAGTNEITFKVIKDSMPMQIDLQKPLEIDSVTMQGQPLEFKRNENVYLVHFPDSLEVGSEHKIKVQYKGQPQASRNPPWSGGVSWQTDDHGKPFIATTAQGIGASIWWPNKDHGYDEPDNGMDIRITVPQDLTAVSNGRLIETEVNAKSQTRTFHWKVTYPINNYCVNCNIGDYIHFSEVYDGENGMLDMDYWVLSGDKERAVKQFKEAPRTIEAFEHWFGPYPFYDDSYKLVQVPYLGMEHQSSVTYGNGFRNGYRGRDLSGTGVGMLFDFIVVHESGHEWFGNNISMKDAADMWIHEGFTNYSENLFVEYHFDEEKAQDYVIGCRRLVQNDRPVIGEYGLNRSGSGDMYYKAGNMLHTMRHIIDDDEKWRYILRGLNKTFWHQTVTTEQVESYINEKSQIDFSRYFDQYLRTTKIPKLIYSVNGKQITCHFENVVDDFAIPVDFIVNGQTLRINVSEKPSSQTIEDPIDSIEVDRNFYVDVEKR
jgi:aminopeptidase N